MSFDEEHLDDHYLCQREVAERDQRIRELERALRHMHDSHHKQPCVCWIQDLLRCSPSRPDNVSTGSALSDGG